MSKGKVISLSLVLVAALSGGAALTGYTYSSSSSTQSTSSSEETAETAMETSKNPRLGSVENPLTVENSPELAAALAEQNPNSAVVKEFFTSHIGDTIQFDGNFASVQRHGDYKTRYDFLIHAGDYSATSVTGPEMRFQERTIYNLNTHMDSVSTGDNVIIVATIEGYNDVSGTVELEPVRVGYRSV